MDSKLAWTDPLPFQSPAASLGPLDTDVAARLLAAAADVTLVLNGDGVIIDLAVGNPDLQAAGAWLGQRWIDTVTLDSQSKVLDMLGERPASRRWRQVNHRLDGVESPVRYLPLELGSNGALIVVGRDLRATAALQQRLIQAQQAMERDHLALRQAESRYRMLFNLSSEAMLILDADTRRIIEANASAEALVGAGKLIGQPFHAIAQERDRELAVEALGAAAAADRSAPVTVRLATDKRKCRLTVSFFRQGRATFYLVRLMPDSASREGPSLDDVLSRVPDPFLMTDDRMTVIAANPAFLEITEWARSDDVIGRPLGHFLGRPGIDIGLMQAELREHGALRKFATILYGRFGTQEEVEASAVAAGEGGAGGYGFSLRRAVPLERTPLLPAHDNPNSIEQLTQLVGRMSLKDIVRESTDLIERLCIEAALRYTSDNRASAAEILGLSRQGLYSKLHRHGLARPGADDTQ